MYYTLSQAAKATGKEKTSIRWAVKNGRITGVLQNKAGGYKIPADSLFSVYPRIGEDKNSSPPLHPSPSFTPSSLVKSSPPGKEKGEEQNFNADKRETQPVSKTEGIKGKENLITPENKPPSLAIENNYFFRVRELELKLEAALQRINDLEKDKTTWQELWKDERETWKNEINAWQKQANALTATVAMLEEKHQQQFMAQKRGFFKRWFGEKSESSS